MDNLPAEFPPAGGSSRQNQDKIRCSIQAVLKVVSAPAHFWDRGARYLVGRFVLGLGDASAFFVVPQRLEHQLPVEWYGRNIYAVRIAVSLALVFLTRPVLMPFQDKGMPLKAT